MDVCGRPLFTYLVTYILMFVCQSIPLELYYCLFASFLPAPAHCVGHALFVHALLVGCPFGDCTWLYVPQA